MGDGIKIEFKAGKTFQRYLKRLEKQGRNLDEIAAVLSEDMLARVLDIFESEGPGWDPLAPATAAARRKSERHKILQDTGVLVGGVEAFHSPHFAAVRNEVPYGIFHVQGTRRMPKRDWSAIDWMKFMADAEKAVAEEVRAGMRS